jgi:hypothetical protein
MRQSRQSVWVWLVGLGFRNANRIEVVGPTLAI